MPRIEKAALLLCALLSLVLVYASQKHLMDSTEVFAFITGAACVYLTVKRSIWNFPIGIANNLFFFVVFYKARLINDTGLQVIYFVLGVWGWWMWARGDGKDDSLPIGRAGWGQLLGCTVFIASGTFVMAHFAHYWGGNAPFWDAFTTSLCLAAQYLLGRKWIDNWAFWLLADIIYVPLYFSRDLKLTAALYFGFGCLCVLGHLSWKKQMEVGYDLENRRDDRQVSAAAPGP